MIPTIIYTSGTSGEPKGVVYSVDNIDYMLPVITQAIGDLMGPKASEDRVFHYLLLLRRLAHGAVDVPLPGQRHHGLDRPQQPRQ